ncbi:MAG: hypothetical protein DI616_13155 [Paracoccus denitrificans]|uniref:Lipoprotein n=1 Tax=Paracoccus denitrificans TaxID=266 RepID=A0A533I297_PARDE|nr:MAG: hypothetical protein DI616_13155 [Paracoccus denitrificans]
MHPAPCLLSLLLLAACMENAATPDADLRMRQQSACASAIADHIRRPVAVVSPRWLSETNGVATVETMDGTRRHLCTVDASGRVTGYSHPRN